MPGAQTSDISNYLRFVNACRRREWLLQTPIGSLQRVFFPRHRLVDRDSYFAEVMRLCGHAPGRSQADYVQELVADEALRAAYLDAIAQGRIRKKYGRYEDRMLNTANVVAFYALIRELRPSVVVETGTATGSMTSWILAALHANVHGRLISIDLPAAAGEMAMDVSVEPDDVGFLIPHDYRGRWRLLLGDAKLLLPRILAEEPADVFFHDSLHTRSHMLFEYNIARCLMRSGAVLLSDDILWNRAFFDFVASHQDWVGKVYVDVGTGEGRANVRNARLMARLLRRTALHPRLGVMYVEGRGAAHTESAWADRLERAVRFLLPRRPGDLHW